MDEAEAHADLSAERGEATPLLEDSRDELRPPVGNRHRGEFSRVPLRHNTDNSTVEPVLPTSSLPRPTRQTRIVATQAAELPPCLKKREPAACLLELSLFPSPPRQARRRREADEDEANLHSAPRTSTGAEKLPLPLPPHLTNTSTSLSSPPRPARGKDEATEPESKKKQPTVKTLLKEDVVLQSAASTGEARKMPPPALGPRSGRRDLEHPNWAKGPLRRTRRKA
jgi:hypothetical protein